MCFAEKAASFYLVVFDLFVFFWNGFFFWNFPNYVDTHAHTRTHHSIIVLPMFQFCCSLGFRRGIKIAHYKWIFTASSFSILFHECRKFTFYNFMVPISNLRSSEIDQREKDCETKTDIQTYQSKETKWWAEIMIFHRSLCLLSNGRKRIFQIKKNRSIGSIGSMRMVMMMMIVVVVVCLAFFFYITFWLSHTDSRTTSIHSTKTKTRTNIAYI